SLGSKPALRGRFFVVNCAAVRAWASSSTTSLSNSPCTKASCRNASHPIDNNATPVHPNAFQRLVENVHAARMNRIAARHPYDAHGIAEPRGMSANAESLRPDMRLLSGKATHLQNNTATVQRAATSHARIFMWCWQADSIWRRMA